HACFPRNFPRRSRQRRSLPRNLPRRSSACLSAVVRQCNWRANNASLKERFAYVQCRQEVTRGAGTAALSANLGLADNDLHAKAAPHRLIAELPMRARSFSLIDPSTTLCE